MTGLVKNKAVYLALGIDATGRREVLGLWIEQTEVAKFWLKVFNDLKNRGVADVLIAVVDGLRGFPEALEATFPMAQTQICIVHLIRNSLSYVVWKDRKAIAAALKPIYQPANAEAAEAALTAFERGFWGTKCPPIAQAWRRQRTQVTPFFAYPPELRRIIYTTNAIENLHMQLRKILKNRGHFPSDVIGHQTALSRSAQRQQEMEHAAAHLEGRGQLVRDHVRSTLHPAGVTCTRLAHRVVSFVASDALGRGQVCTEAFHTNIRIRPDSYRNRSAFLGTLQFSAANFVKTPQASCR